MDPRELQPHAHRANNPTFDCHILIDCFTARCYASALLAMGLCLSVSVSVCHKSVFYRNG